MDQNYLSHIEASPYVDEAFLPASWKAKGAGLAQYFKNKMGVGAHQSPQQSKLLSYNTSFINEVKNLLRIFLKSSMLRRMEKDPRLTAEHEEMLNKLEALYESLLSPVNPTNPDPQWSSSQSDSFDSFVEESDAPTISLTQAVGRVTEGWADDLTDPSKILPMVLHNLKKVYDKFAVRIQKEFGVPPSFDISKFVERQLPNHPTSKNVSAIEKVVKDAETFGKPVSPAPVAPATAATGAGTPPTAAPATAPPSAPAGPASVGENGGKGVKLSQEQNAQDLAYLLEIVLKIIAQRVMKSESSHPHSYFAKPLAGGGYHLPTQPDEPEPTDPTWAYPELPAKLKSMSQSDLDALPPDSPEAKAYKAYREKMLAYPYTHVGGTQHAPEKYVYKTTGVPPTPASQMDADIANFLAKSKNPITEVDVEPEPEPGIPTDSKKKKDDEDEIESEEDLIAMLQSGDFLYAFGGLYRKHPGKYSLEVTEGNNGVQVKFPSGKVKVIRVFWEWQSTINTIHVRQRYPDDTEWTMYPVMRFSDAEILTGKPPEVEKFVKDLNPRLGSLLEKANTTGLQNTAKQFAPAAYAISRRKGPMEHKPYKSLKFHIADEWKSSKPGDPTYGMVKLLYGKIKGHKRGENVPLKSLKVFYHGTTDPKSKEILDNALKECGYWESYPDIDKMFRAPILKIGEEGVTWNPDGTVLVQNKGDASPKKINPMTDTLSPDVANSLNGDGYWDLFPNMPGKPAPKDAEPTAAEPAKEMSPILDPVEDWNYTKLKGGEGVVLNDGTNSITLTNKQLAYILIDPYNTNSIPGWPKQNIKHLFTLLTLIKYFEHNKKATSELLAWRKAKAEGPKTPDTMVLPTPTPVVNPSVEVPKAVAKPPIEMPTAVEKPSDETPPVEPKGKPTKPKKVSKPVEPSKKVPEKVPEKPAAAVEPQPTPEPKPENVGTAAFTKKTGVVKWTKPDGKVRTFSPAQLNTMQSKLLWKALHNAGYPFKKFKVKTNENIINPYQFANLL